MSEWKEYRIDELGKLGRGKSKHRPRNDASLFNGEYPFVQTGDIKAANFYLTEYSQTYTEKGLAQSKLWKKGTLCITIAANIGETAILGLDACFPDSIIGFTPYENKSDVRFIKYLFDLLKIHFQSISQGTTQDNLSQEKLLTIKFKAPDFQTQQKIANILGTYDELIEVNNERIKILEETAQSLYKEWFVRFRFPNYQNTEFIKGVPKGWEIGNIFSVAEVKGGGTPSTINEQYWNGNIPFYTPTDFDNNFFIFETEKNITDKGLNNSSTKIFPKRITFITARGTVGNICISANEMAMNQSCFAILPHNFENYAYLFLYVGQMVNFFKQVSTGATFDAFNLSTFKNYEVLIPEEKLISKFSDFVNPIFAQIETLQQQNTELRQIRDRLLPRLISGKMVV